MKNNGNYVNSLNNYEIRRQQAAAGSDDNKGLSGGGGSDSGCDSKEFEVPEDGAWVIQLKGYHYFNKNNETGYKSHVQYALLERLRHSILNVPTPFGVTRFSMEEMGVNYIVLVDSKDEGEVRNHEGKEEGPPRSGSSRRKPRQGSDLLLGFPWH